MSKRYKRRDLNSNQNKKNLIKTIANNDKTTIDPSSNTFEKAQQEMNEIFQLFTLNKVAFNQDKEGIKQRLEKYLNTYHRILYSTISVSIFELDNELKDNVIQNLTSLANSIDLSEEMKEIDKVILKLLDHILLANNQLSTLEVTEEKVKPIVDQSIKSLNITIRKQTSKINTLKNDVKKDIDAQKDGLLSQMIAIVSIFVAISFVMFGGMSLLNGLFDFSEMSYVPVSELLCLGAMFGIIMLAIIYAFMYFVLRITEKEIKRHKFFNIAVIVIIIILLLICFCTFDYWEKSPNINIYDNDIVETE